LTVQRVKELLRVMVSIFYGKSFKNKNSIFIIPSSKVKVAGKVIGNMDKSNKSKQQDITKIKLSEEYFNEAAPSPRHFTSPDYVGPEFAKKASDEDLQLLVKLKGEKLKMHDKHVRPIEDQIAKLMKKYGIRGVKESINEREYSTAQREDMADSGEALPDGSYPIADREDLENAIKAYGRAKDQSAAAKHIAKRARALGLAELIPDTEDFQKSLKA